MSVTGVGAAIGRRVVAEWLADNPCLPVPDEYQADVDTVNALRRIWESVDQQRVIARLTMLAEFTGWCQYTMRVNRPGSFITITGEM